jgi:release factor glutamine methyltransferase
MPSPNRSSYFGGLRLTVYPEVYEPAEDSYLFAENLHVLTGSRVLDVGTGSGLLALIAAQTAREVVTIDVNPYALRCAKQNSQNNNLAGNMHFIQSDLFIALSFSAKFDLIIFNSPYLPSEPGEDAFWLGRAWAGGLSGRKVIDRFIAQAPMHLEKGGKILLLQSNLANIETTLDKFAALGLVARLVVELSLPFFEKLVLIEAQ